MTLSFGQLFFSVQGRISRKTYWQCLLPMFIAYIVASLMSEAGDAVIVGIGGIAQLALIWPSVAIAAKRWHDRGKSGWWYLISFIPFIGPLWVVIELGFLSGTHGPNRFGYDPLGRTAGRPSTSASPPPPLGDQQRESDHSQLPNGFVDLISMLAKMAKSDGAVSPEEVAVVDAFFQEVLSLSNELRKEAISIFTLAKDTGVLFEHHARRFYQSNSDNHDLLSGALSLLFSVATADDEMSSEEEILISQAISIFGVDCPEYTAYRARQRSRSSPRGEAGERHYASVLGLRGRTTKEDVRKAYRDLVTQYHPDKVAHLGEKLRTVAEEEMKKINEAYEYFRRKYAF
ncbi:MAG: DUF805 domain-containing protein [Kiritimatiellae bacterium]|nr:DUF805 domain-containing protein [Kiritimatiellia bacterium]